MLDYDCKFREKPKKIRIFDGKIPDSPADNCVENSTCNSPVRIPDWFISSSNIFLKLNFDPKYSKIGPIFKISIK